MKSITIKSLLAAALLLPFAANAVPISGDIGLSGALLPTCGGISAGCDMDVADGLDFDNDQALVTFATGDFALAGLGFGSIAAINDFEFDPFAGIDPLWTAGGFSFALTDLNILMQTSSFLEMRGTGMISGGGLDDTLGNWSFSADLASGATTFSWSSTAAPVPAPEPGILVLVGMGLIGGFGARRLTRS